MILRDSSLLSIKTMLVRNFYDDSACIGQEESIAWCGMTAMVQEKGTAGNPLTKQISLTNLTCNMMRCLQRNKRLHNAFLMGQLLPFYRIQDTSIYYALQLLR